MVDICALSTVHYAYDSRIYHKQARSLAAAGFRVTVVARAETDAPPDDTVEIRPVASHRLLWGHAVRSKLAGMREREVVQL